MRAPRPTCCSISSGGATDRAFAPTSSTAFARASRAWSKERARFAPSGSTTATSPSRRSPRTAPTPDRPPWPIPSSPPSASSRGTCASAAFRPSRLAELFLDRLERLGPALQRRRHRHARPGAGRGAARRARDRGADATAARSTASPTGRRTSWRRRAASRPRGAPRRSARRRSTTTPRWSRKLDAAGGGARRPSWPWSSWPAAWDTASPTRRSPGRGSIRGTRTTWSGGSSSGSGSAVAAGLVPFAIGSETWGSILSPAGNCGVSRAPAHLRSREPPRRDGALLDARQARAARPHRRRLRPRARRHRRARSRRSPDDRTARSATTDADAPDRRFRFGVVRSVLDGCEPGVLASFERSLAVLRTIGTIEEVDAARPSLRGGHADHPLGRGGERLRGPDRERRHRGAHRARRTTTMPYARDAILAKDYIKALRLRGVMAREVDRVLAPRGRARGARAGHACAPAARPRSSGARSAAPPTT